MQLFGFLFVNGQNIKSQDNVKEKFDIAEVLWVIHIYKVFEPQRNIKDKFVVLWVTHITIFTKTMLEITEGIKYTISVKWVLLKNKKV